MNITLWLLCAGVAENITEPIEVKYSPEGPPFLFKMIPSVYSAYLDMFSLRSLAKRSRIVVLGSQHRRREISSDAMIKFRLW
jgi:hypothetical protein